MNWFTTFLGLRKVMVRAHRQAWCWQDEWYGLTIEDIRQLELETQLALARTMAQFCQAEEATEASECVPSPDKDKEVKEAISSIEAEETDVRSAGETLQPRGVLTKQWSTSSRSSRSSKRGGEEHVCQFTCTIFVCSVLYLHYITSLQICVAIPESTFSSSFPGSSAHVFLLSHIITPAAIFDVLDAFIYLYS